MSPMKGKVAPEETVPFMVTLKASVHASFYSMDLVCKVGPLSERSWDGTQLPILGRGGGAVVSEIPRSAPRPLFQGPTSGKVGGPQHRPRPRPSRPGLLSPFPEPQVYQQEHLRQYRKELQEWKDEKLRQEVEFTITDRKVKVRRAEWALKTTEPSG